MYFTDEHAAELIELATACCSASVGEEPELLLQTWQTLQSLPPSVLKLFTTDFPSREGFEGLVQSGAYESAALRLFGSTIGFMYSRSPTGVHLTTVFVEGLEELAVAGETFALSACAALLVAVGAKAGRGSLLPCPDRIN